jgi:hypothetical protein
MSKVGSLLPNVMAKLEQWEVKQTCLLGTLTVLCEMHMKNLSSFFYPKTVSEGTEAKCRSIICFSCLFRMPISIARRERRIELAYLF